MTATGGLVVQIGKVILAQVANELAVLIGGDE